MLLTVGCSGPEEAEPEEVEPLDPLEVVQPEIDPNSLTIEGIEYNAGGRRYSGILSRYPGLLRAPVLIALHDEYGFDAWFLKRIENYARLNPGVVVVAPDFRDWPDTRSEEALVENIRSAVNAAIEVVGYSEQPRIGVIGWSIGGTRAVIAGRYLDLDLVITCYGRLPFSEEELFDLREPVRGVYGQDDEKVPMTHVVNFGDRMSRLAGDFEAQVWQDEGHMFLRDPNEPSNAREAEDEIIFWIDRFLIMN
ncbi:MAG: dienelactone hydrolase family protein [Planctomycetota bacterium]